jgi:hypothetical protein
LFFSGARTIALSIFNRVHPRAAEKQKEMEWASRLL